MIKHRIPVNIAANFLSALSTTAIRLVFIPIYLRLLGVEAYGLIGFYATLFAALQVLDFGLSTAINRELARYSAGPDMRRDARDLVHTLEWIYLLLGIFIGILVALLAPYLATNWIRAESIPEILVTTAIRIMGLTAALQWPIKYYQGALYGLQDQVQLSVVNVLASIIRDAGAALALWILASNLSTYFYWQSFANGLHTLFLVILLWRQLALRYHKPAFKWTMFHGIRQFTLGMTGINITGIVISQLDKLFVSRLASLTTFGYYTLATVISTGLSLITVPVHNAIFPRISLLVEKKDIDAVRQLYHRGTQLMAILLLPLGFTVAIFASEVVFFWTGSAETAYNVAPILRWLVLGSAINGLMHLPYSLQLSYGWTRIGVQINLLLIAVMIPMLVIFIDRYGASGGAFVWAFINLVYMLFAIPMTHQRLLVGDAGRWIVHDVLLPAIGPGAFTLIAHLVIPGNMLRPMIGIVVISVVAIGMILSVAGTRDLRAWAYKEVSKWRIRKQ